MGLTMNDETAVRVVKTVAKNELPTEQTELSAEQIDALRKAFDIQPDAGTSTDGQVALAALDLLAAKSEMGEKIASLASTEPPERYEASLIESILLITAVLAVLKSHVDIQRDKQGRWSVRILSEPLDNALLKPFVEKLLAWLPSK